MFQTLSMIIALIGSSIAAAWDLKTTEIPDQIPHAMVAIALIIYSVQSVLLWDYWPILGSAIAGGLLFAFGFALYRLGQWGGGDAKLLSAIGFLLPAFVGAPVVFPFPVSYLFNVFFVGAGYMMVYALAMAFKDRKILSSFKSDVCSMKKHLLIWSVILFAAVSIIGVSLSNYMMMPLDANLFLNSAMVTAAALGVFILFKFARAVETVGFKKKIPVSKLKVGDVLMDSKVWDGITEKDLRRIQKSGKRYVRIKEGVRFAPAFPLGLLFTILVGDAFFLLFSLI